MAREVRVGLILRRGPSKEVCSIRWDRKRDTFELGQWLRGRIYERRSDLSPDGRWMIYFAMNGKWSSTTGGSWTAISRVPWLKASALFGKGDCWHGGGLFTGKRTYWLNDGFGHRLMTPTSAVERDVAWKPPRNFGGECPGVYYIRLLRDGWRHVRHEPVDSDGAWTEFEKPLPHGWTLRKFAHAETGAPQGKGCYWDEHELVHAATKTSIPCPDWEWADLDAKTLVWVEKGKLFRAPIAGAKGPAAPVLLKDFNDMKFKAIKAP